MAAVTIFHNPRCGTSRNTLALIRNAGIEPELVLYLEAPPTREQLVKLIADSGLSVREIMRTKEAVCAELGLDAPSRSDAELIDAMLMHPVLINRPIVVTELGTRLCRPSELVIDILPAPQQGPFAKEDGEVVIDEQGHRVR